MKKQMVLFATLLLFGSSVVHAQTVTAYTYVQQNGTKVTADGTAAFDVSSNSATLEFVDGNAVMTIGDNTVAKLPVTDGNGGELCADFKSNTGAGTITQNVTTEYGTIYSPFMLTVPDNAQAYAPTYDETNQVLLCTNSVAGKTLPAGTALLLKQGNYSFGLTATASTFTSESALSGTALEIARTSVEEDGYVIYTLGYIGDDTSKKMGFWKFTGENLNAGRAYFKAGATTGARGYISVIFDETPTAIQNADSNATATREGKFIENGRVVILKDGKKFNLNGQEVK